MAAPSTPETGVCAWPPCDRPVARTSRKGIAPRTCQPSHRQRLYELRNGIRRGRRRRT